MNRRSPAGNPFPAGVAGRQARSPEFGLPARSTRRLPTVLLTLALVGLLPGCGQDQDQDDAGAGERIPVTPYQTIPPPLIPPRAPATPQAIHWTATQLPSPADGRLVDSRTAIPADLRWVETARRIEPRSWLEAPAFFRMTEIAGRVDDWRRTPTHPVMILADNDYQAAGAWLMLRSVGLTNLHVIWLGAASLRTAHWRTGPSAPAGESLPTPATNPGQPDPDDPAWMLTDAQFSGLTTGLTPVSRRKPSPILDSDATAPSQPQAAEPPPPAPPTQADPADPAPPPPPAPATATPEPVDGFIFCGSQEAWQATAEDDRLIQGAVRVPPLEMYRATDGSLDAAPVRQARLAQLHLNPAGHYVLFGPNAADIAAVFLALDSAGYTHLRVYLP